MPTQKRIFPPKNIGRYTYLDYFKPQRFLLSAREPMQQLLRKQVDIILNAPLNVIEEGYARLNKKERTAEIDFSGDPELEDLVPNLGIKPAVIDRNRPFHAIKYIAECDKEWPQCAMLWKIFKQLKPREQRLINRVYKKKWQRRSQCTWEWLISTIARDQQFFREALIIGPTAAGLVGTRLGTTQSLISKFALSQSTGSKIYKAYRAELSRVLGDGATAPQGLRRVLTRLGYLDAHGRFPSRPIEKFLISKSPEERKLFSDIGIHFFAHALRNLQNWRYGKRPIAWSAYACMDNCLKLQERLAR
jgi:hypothetical protein